MRIRDDVDSRLNQNHALDFGDQAHNYARLERHKGDTLFQTIRCSLCFLIGINNPRVLRFGLVWAAGIEQ